jgi:dTDP-4-amino-4,6-dideoxygalactose transaminase
MWAFKDHGKSYEAVYERQHPPGFRWLHETFGTNWRMLEMQAAIGRIQLRRMADWTAARVGNAQAMEAALTPLASEDGPLRIPKFGCGGCSGCSPEAGCTHARYKYYVYVRPERLAAGWTRDAIVSEMVARGVPCYQGSCSEVYLEKAFEGTGWRPKAALPIARELGETSLMFLAHPTLTAEEVARTADTAARVIVSRT